ncbi:MAG TPA: DUF2085 domain-containing protein [Vicinamibacterales bacterium]
MNEWARARSNMGGVRLLARILAIASVGWVAAVVAAPFAVQSSNPLLSGPAIAVYAASGFICHQRPERSFWLWGEQLPVCARCAGLYVAAALGAPLAAVYASGFTAARAWGLAIVTGFPTLLTWSAEAAGLAHPSNTVRAVAALPLGFAVAWLLVGTLLSDRRPA